MRLILTTFSTFFCKVFFLQKNLLKNFFFGSNIFSAHHLSQLYKSNLADFLWDFFCQILSKLLLIFLFPQQTNSSIWKKAEMVCCGNVFPINLILYFDCAEFPCPKSGRQTFVCISWWSLFAFLQHTKNILKIELSANLNQKVKWSRMM